MARVTIYERGKSILSKVKVSGGGRCNVTHACYEPGELIQYYPRGAKALLGPFHQFCCGDMVAWLEEKGVPTKVEADGRIFPTSDDSQTIIDCLWQAASNARVLLKTRHRLERLDPPTTNRSKWVLHFNEDQSVQADRILIASGSSTAIWEELKRIGHTIVAPVPSLFTFNIKDTRIDGLAGVSVPKAAVYVLDTKLEADGPLLITHWGMSGPGILKLSAWGARELNDADYRFTIRVNWLCPMTTEQLIAALQHQKSTTAKKELAANACFGLPNRLWKRIVQAAAIPPAKRWADLSKKEASRLAEQLTNARFEVHGKSTFKEEFVTAGGVALKEINFKNFESKLHPGLFFAGEVLNIDAVTGGFNFQAAWTGAWIAGKAMGQ